MNYKCILKIFTLVNKSHNSTALLANMQAVAQYFWVHG